MTGRLVAWHGDPDLRVAMLTAMAAHREADELVRGTYWSREYDSDRWRGCAVGHHLYPVSGE